MKIYDYIIIGENPFLLEEIKTKNILVIKDKILKYSHGGPAVTIFTENEVFFGKKVIILEKTTFDELPYFQQVSKDVYTYNGIPSKKFSKWLVQYIEEGVIVGCDVDPTNERLNKKIILIIAVIIIFIIFIQRNPIII